MTLWKALEKIPHLKSDGKFKLPCFNPLVIGFYYGVNNSTLHYEFTLGAWSIMVPTKTQVWTSNNHFAKMVMSGKDPNAVYKKSPPRHNNHCLIFIGISGCLSGPWKFWMNLYNNILNMLWNNLINNWNELIENGIFESIFTTNFFFTN